MNRNIITIDDNGTVTVASDVRMRDFEIAQLFGVFTQTIKANIKTILQSGIVRADLTDGGVMVGNHIFPDYYGLDMITALAFRVQSPQAEMFRTWALRKMVAKNNTVHSSVFISMDNKALSQLMN
ncbi:MAG: hypothetical protein KA753_00220 [Paludibacter sp.]|nr:hypothetical protein [Paludibacter sp.]